MPGAMQGWVASRITLARICSFLWAKDQNLGSGSGSSSALVLLFNLASGHSLIICYKYLRHKTLKKLSRLHITHRPYCPQCWLLQRGRPYCLGSSPEIGNQEGLVRMKVSGQASAKKSFQKEVGWPEGSRAGDTRREWMGLDRKQRTHHRGSGCGGNP